MYTRQEERLPAKNGLSLQISKTCIKRLNLIELDVEQRIISKPCDIFVYRASSE